ncbi:MAG: metallophosphoesterase [Myxococcales bacterium]
MALRRATRREVLQGGLAIVASGLGVEACGSTPGGGALDAAIGGADAGLDASTALDAAARADASSALEDAAVAQADAAGEPADAAAQAGSDAAAPDAGNAAPRPTTSARTRIEGVLSSEKHDASLKSLWGVTKTVAGEAHQRRDDLGADATADVATAAEASLLYLAHLTDIHVIDEESPARTINLDRVAGAAWHYQEAHASQVLDAMVRKLRALDAARPLDLALFTGDLIDNNQKNELGWFLKVLEGGPLQPNSGDLENPLPGTDDDPHDSFTAMGLGPIPWAIAPGNHDLLIQGNLPMTPPLYDYSPVTGDPRRGTIGRYDLGRVNPPACNAIPGNESPTPPRCIPTPPSSLTAGTLPADPNRANLTRDDFLAAVRAAPGLPAGHGYGQALASSGDGDYVLEPVPGLPLRVVVLNTTAAGSAAGFYPKSKINGFLADTLAQAEQDQALVIVASHHPSDTIVGNGDELRAKLNACPNVVLHLVGHTHDSLVTPRPGATPQHGYWEVTTAGLVAWPQQARLVELVDKRDGTAELWLTMVDFDTDHGSLGALAEASRFLALYEVHAGLAPRGEGSVGDRNLVLPVALTPELRAKLAALPGQPVESKLFA